MKLTLPFLAGIFFIASSHGAAASDFIHPSWLCVSPEAYATAMQGLAGKSDAEVDEAKGTLSKDKICTYLTDPDLRNIITGVRIMQTQGEYVRVMFGMQSGNQIPSADSTTTRSAFFRMSAWTARTNLSVD